MRVQFSFWLRWLLIASSAVTLFGLLMALAADTPLFWPLESQINPVFWPDGGPEGGAVAFSRWVYGTWGATIAGWGICLVALVWVPLRARKRWAWLALSLGLLLWFGLDTLKSLQAGVVFNAIFNTLVLALVGTPLLLGRRHFRK